MYVKALPEFNADLGDQVTICVAQKDECAPGCLFTFLGNGVCEEVCFNEECGYDKVDCVICDDACTYYMIGNGTCDPACNMELCDFDGGDCHEEEECLLAHKCSVDCLWSEVGNRKCNPNCLSA